MSDPFTNKFFTWADSTGITRHDLANATGNSVQTISKWRSIGIPKGKKPICQMLMKQHQHRAAEDKTPFRIHFEISRERFTKWNKAALAANMTIEDWAFDGLERMADKQFIDTAAEDPTKHSAEKSVRDKIIKEIEAMDDPIYNEDIEFLSEDNDQQKRRNGY